MKDFRLKFAAVVGCMVVFLMLMGWAGAVDYTEQVILHMSQEEYDSVRSRLLTENGHEPSQSEIAQWWVEHNGE